MNKKIAYIVYHYWPPFFGGELLISIERFQELAKRGHRVTVLTSGVPGFATHEVQDGIEIYRSPMIHDSWPGRGLRRLLFPIWVNWRLRKIPVDVVHLESTGGIGPITSNLSLAWINRAAHRRGAHTLWVLSLADTEKEAFSTKGVEIRLRNFSLKRVDTIVSVGPTLHRGVLQIFPEKAVCILCGVRDDIFKPIPNNEREELRGEMGVSPSEIVFCFLGSVGRRKGFDLLAQAFADLSIKYPNWRLWVIGPRTARESQNIDPKEVDQVCAPLGNLDQKVRYWGRVNDRNYLANLLSSSDIFILPSVREGMALAPMEAMAAGIPVIISRLPGVTDIATSEEETGLFIEPGDLASLRTAMIRLAVSAELRLQMGLAAVKRVHDLFSWKKHVSDWENLYCNFSNKGSQS